MRIPGKKVWMRGVALAASAVLGALPLTPAAFAANPATIGSCGYTGDPTHSYRFCGTGTSTDVAVPSQSAVTYSFGYPGGGVDITFTARVSAITPTFERYVGVAIFDTDRPLGNGIPLETADLPDNGLGGAPNVMQFNYSSGRNGPVVLKFYNYSPADVTFSLDDSGLQLSNGTVVPLLLALGSTGTATQVAGVDCAYALGMSLFVARTDDPTGQPMFQVTGPCAGGEFSDMATGNVQQKTANGWLQWVKAANRVDYDDGTSVWYGCQNGIVEVPRIAAVPC